MLCHFSWPVTQGITFYFPTGAYFLPRDHLKEDMKTVFYVSLILLNAAL